VMVAAVMTAAVICEGGRRAVIGQNGDTRGYLYSGGDLMLLTEDQDAVQSDQAQGILTPDQAAALVDRPHAPDFLGCGFVHIGVWGRRPTS